MRSQARLVARDDAPRHRLSPHFTEADFFGAFSMIDVGRPDVAYAMLQQGFKANPGDWRFPFYLGFFAYTYGTGRERRVAAQWYADAARLPGAPEFVSRLAAELATKGSSKQTAIDCGPRCSPRATSTLSRRPSPALDQLLPKDKVAREKAVAAFRRGAAGDVRVSSSPTCSRATGESRGAGAGRSSVLSRLCHRGLPGCSGCSSAAS